MTLIRTLTESDRDAVKRHFQSLDDDAVRTRFFSFVGKEARDRYVDKMDFKDGIVLGIESQADGSIVGLAEVATTRDEGVGEMAFTVAVGNRGKGLGGDLAERALLAARNRGFDTVHLYCMPENSSMKSLAKKMGMEIHRGDGELEGSLHLQAPTGSSVMEELGGEFSAIYVKGVNAGVSVMLKNFETMGRVGRMGGLGLWAPMLDAHAHGQEPVQQPEPARPLGM